MNRDEFVIVFAGTSVEAEMARIFLEDNGIAAHMAEEHIGTLAPWLSAAGGAGAVKVLVPEEHAEHARTLLAKHKHE